MVERAPGERPWDIAAIAECLSVGAERTADIAFGPGVRFSLDTALDATSVELFSAAAAARITSPDLQLTLRHLEPPEIQAEQVVLAVGLDGETRYRTAVSASGEITLVRAADDGSIELARLSEPLGTGERSAREASLERAVRMLTDALDRCGGDDPACPHCGPAQIFAAEVLGHPLEPSPQSNPTVLPVAEERGVEEDPPSRAERSRSTAPKRERLTLNGRVGAAPSFRTTASGLLIARFPIAIHLDDNQTRWQTVVAFGAKAERLREALQKGQLVEVVGYAHDRQVTKRDGAVKNVNEIYAAAVRTR